MEINRHQLATDLDYWNSVAPEGAECLIDNNYYAKWSNGVEFVYPQDGNDWAQAKLDWPLSKYVEREEFAVIMKPSGRADAVPPVKILVELLATDLDYWNSVAPEGAQCYADSGFSKWHDQHNDHTVEYRWMRDTKSWKHAAIPWTLDQYLACKQHNSWVVIVKPTSRCTKDQLLRQLIEHAYHQQPRGHSGGLDAVAEAILEHYTLEPKQ